MGTLCANINTNDAKELNESIQKSIVSFLRGTTKVSTKGLTREELIAIVSQIMTDKRLSEETVISTLKSQEGISLLNDYIGKARIEKQKEEQELKKLYESKVQGVKFSVATTHFTKNDPVRNPTTLYIYADNLQASNEVFGEQIGDTIEVEGGVKLNVNGSSAQIRTNNNGDVNPNVIGIVTKKNAQRADGRFITEEGYFQDTDEDLAIFEEANKRVIDKIKRLLSSEESKFSSIVMVQGLATEKSSLPQRFAERLQQMLREELKIETQLTLNKDGRYGLTVQGKSREAISEREKTQKAKKAIDLYNSLVQSLAAKRPDLVSVSVKRSDLPVLTQLYPNIERRLARINFLSEQFSSRITQIIQDKIDELNSKEISTDEDYFLVNGLTKGKREEQRIFALKYLTKDGLPIVQAIIKDLRETFYAFKQINDMQDLNEKAKRIRELSQALLSEDTELGEDFLEELESLGVEDRVEMEKRASARADYLVQEYSKMANDDVFYSLLKEAFMEIEFNEDIRLDFKQQSPVQSQEEEEEDKKEEDKENANREGYMVKYKLLDPAKTLSVEIKKLLGSIYKTDPKDSSKHVFTDLGTKVRMDALTAYRILQEEFSQMLGPEDFIRILDNTIEKYPWFSELRDILVYNEDNSDAFNEDLRNEFYRTMRKAQVPYGIVSTTGRLQRVNRSNSGSDIMDNVRKNYEGRVVLGKFSIYDDSGEPNSRNLEILDSLFRSRYKERQAATTKEERAQKKENIRAQRPLGWALARLREYAVGGGKVQDVVKAIVILQEGKYKGVTLEDILQDIGVDTSVMDIDSLFGSIPFLSEDELELLEQEGKDEDGKVSIERFSIEYLPKKSAMRLVNILNSISNIVYQSIDQQNRRNTEFREGVHLINAFQSNYIQIGTSLALATEGYTAMTFRHNGKTRATYAAPDFISELVGHIKDDSKSVDDVTGEEIYTAEEWLFENYGRYDFYRNQETGEWTNSWLENFFVQESGQFPFRKAFEYMNILSFMGNSDETTVQNIAKENLLLGLVHTFYSAGDTMGRKFGYYRIPLVSDVDAIVALKGERYSGDGYQETIKKKLVKLIWQEVDRIESILHGDNSTTIERYNDDQSNGLKFCYLPELNEDRDTILKICRSKRPDETAGAFSKRAEEELIKLLNPIIQEKLDRFLNQLSEADKIRLVNRLDSINKGDKEEDQTTDRVQLNIEDLQKEESKKTETEEQRKEKLKRADQYLTEFWFNDFYAQSQIQQLLGGDLAYYKNYQDFIKRNKQCYASGERLFSKQTDEQGNIIGDLVETVIYMEDDEIMSTSYESLKKMLLKNSDKLDETTLGVIKFALEQYKKINATDGQSFRTLTSFRKIFKAMGGKWTDDMEIAYQHIMKGEDVTTQDFFSLWNPIKPFFFGSESVVINGRMEKLPVQHKNSEYAMTALCSILNTMLNNSPKLRALQKFMEDHDIDVVHFHSVVKVGYNSPFDISYNKAAYNSDLKNGKVTINGESFTKSYEKYKEKLIELLDNGKITQEQFNEHINRYQFTSYDSIRQSLEEQSKQSELMFKQFPLSSYMIVQPSGDHLTDEEAIYGSQLRNIIMADLPESFTLTLNIDGTDITMNREQAVRLYNTLLVDNILDSFKKIGREFSDINSLQEALFARMEGNPQYGEDVKQALQINKDGTGFMLPFNSPNLSNKIEQLILSVFKNEIQRQKIKGGNAVLVSNFGLSNQLKVVYNDENDTSKGVKYIEALLPSFTEDLFSDFLKTDENGNTIIDFKEVYESLKETGAEELFDIIGYRIPTEDKYSIMPIRVVGFLPVQAGSTIMLPEDIITMSGTDFDIDKLFLMIKEYDRISYHPNLGKAFNDYCKSNNIEHKPLNLNKRGYKESYINQLIENDEIFRRFMDEEGKSFKYTKPKYYVLKPRVRDANGELLSLDEISRQPHVGGQRARAIRNNMLIDIIRGTLQNSEASKIMMQPGNFIRVKLSSRQQKIMHDIKAFKMFYQLHKDRIKEVGLFETLKNPKPKELKSEKDVIRYLEKFFDKYSTSVSPLDIVDYINNQRNLMDGNALIGLFAVNSSNHYKLQFVPLTIDEDHRFIINGVEVSRIDLINSPFTGERIGRINAEYQAASPDNGKDPCLGDVGASVKTAKRIGFLARIGLTPEEIGFLNTIDDLKPICKAASKKCKKEKIFVPPVNTFNLDLNVLADYVFQYRTDPKAFVKLISEDREALVYMAAVGEFMYNIDTLSGQLREISKVSRSDSPNGALAVTLPEALQQYFIIQDFVDFSKNKAKCYINGLDQLINSDIDAANLSEDQFRREVLATPVPRLQAAFTCGIKSALTLCSTRLPGLAPIVLQGIQMLRDETNRSYTTSADLLIFRRFLGDLTMAILSTSPQFSGDENMSILDKRNYYIHDFPIKFKEFLDRKKSDEESIEDFAEKFAIKALNIIKRITNNSGKGIKFLNVGKISDKGRKYYREELESLLSSEDQDVLDFAMDLFMYSYFDNGFQFSHNNFGIFYSTFYYKVMPQFIETLEKGNSQLIDGTFNMQNFIMQFLLNNPTQVHYIEDTAYELQGEDKLIPKLDNQNKSKFYSGYERSTGSMYTLIRANNRIWVLTQENGKYYYKPIAHNEFTMPFYDMNTNFSELELDKLKPRGVVGTVSQRTKELAKKVSSDTVQWAVKADNSYEVSTAGDKRFSALNATFQEGTIFEGQDVGGYTIEEVYQTFAKHGELSKNWQKYKGKGPSEGSLVYTDKELTKEEYENHSYEKAYLPLWQLWAEQNPELIEDLREKSKGKILTDKYASRTTVSQARALADILNMSTIEQQMKKQDIQKPAELDYQEPDDTTTDYYEPVENQEVIIEPKDEPSLSESDEAAVEWVANNPSDEANISKSDLAEINLHMTIPDYGETSGQEIVEPQDEEYTEPTDESLESYEPTDNPKNKIC